MDQAKQQNSPQSSRGEEKPLWPAVGSAGLATFSVVTTEMLPVGLVTPIATDLQASIGNAGLMISVPALVAAVFAPVVTIVAGGQDRRRILVALLVLLTIANLMSAFASTMDWMLAARIVVGVCMGGIWTIAGGLAPRFVPQQSVGLATAIIFGGVSAASVLGVPAGAIIGDFAGWRVAFGATAAFSALVLIMNLRALPPLPVSRPTAFSQFSDQVRQRPVQLGLVVTLLFVAGHFMAYTFVRPLLQTMSGIEAEWIGVLLFAYGAAGIFGNFLVGAIAVRRIEHTLTVIAVALATTIFGFAFVGTTPAGGAMILILWGIAYGGVSVALQTWMMKAAPTAIEVGTSLFVATFNIGIALGSFIGGRVVDYFGLHSNMLLATSLPAVGLFFSLVIRSYSLRPAGMMNGHPNRTVGADPSTSEPPA